MEVAKCVTVSSANVTPRACRILDRLASDELVYESDSYYNVPFSVYKKGKYGYFLYPSDDYDKGYPLPGGSGPLISLWKYAEKEGAGIVVIDRDAEKTMCLRDYTEEWRNDTSAMDDACGRHITCSPKNVYRREAV